MCCAAMDSYENIFFSQEAYPSIDFTLLDRPASRTTSAPHSTAALLPDLHNADSPFPSFDQNGVYSLGGLRVADEAYLREHGDFRPELQEFHARHKKRLLQLRSGSTQGRKVGEIKLGLPSTHQQLPLESHSPVSSVNLSSNHPLEQSQMQMLSSHNETAAEVHDFFEQTQITQEQGTTVSGGQPHLSQAWPGINGRDVESQMGYHVTFKSEASNARDWIGNRLGNPELSNHLSSQSSLLLSSQPANDDASLKVTHPFLPVGQQSTESRSLQNVQSSSNPTVIRSQPRNQPLDFEGLFAGSTTQFETGNASSVQKERIDESSLVGQNVLYNHVQNMKLACQNHEIMPQERPSQNHNRGGQISLKANLEGAFGQHPGMETAQYMQQHVLYQQHLQEMHRQQQILQLEQHSQWSRQQQLQLFWAAQNKGFATQFSQEQNLLKVGAECWQSPYQPRFYQPQNTSGNVYWPVLTSSSMLDEINNHSLGPSMLLQQLAPNASTLNSSIVNCSSNNRRDNGTVVSENSLPNAQVGVDYCSGGMAKHAIGGPLLNLQGPYDPNTAPSTHPGVLLSRNSSYNNYQIDKLQPCDRFPFGQITQEAGFQSRDSAKNTNSYYEEGFQSSSRMVDYPIGQQQNWAGVSGHEEEAQVMFCSQRNPQDATRSSMLRSDFEKQEIYQKINSPQSGSEPLLRNQSKIAGTHQYLQQGRSHLTRVDTLNKASLKQQGGLTAQGMQHQSSQDDEAMDSAQMEVEGQSSWSNLLLQDTHFQSGNSHQTRPDVKQQAVWNDVNLQNGSSLSGSTLCLFTDLDGRHSIVDSDPQRSSQVVRKTGVECQFSESRLSQEHGSLQTGNSFLAHDGSAEMLQGNWKTHSLQQANAQSGNPLQAFLELEEKLDEDLPYQQLLQRAIEDDDPFQLTEMDWQHQNRSWDQTLQCDGLHGQAIFPSNQCMSRESEAEIAQERVSISRSTQISNKADSQIQNSEEYFVSAGISQSHAGGLEGRPQNVQVSDRMQAQTFQLPRNVVAKKVMGQAERRVRGCGSDVGTNLDASGVDVRSKEEMQNLQNNALVGNLDYVAQELASKLWASRNVTSMQELSPQLWSLNNAVDNSSGMKQKDCSVISAVEQRGNNVDFARQELHDDREKLLKMKHSVLESPQKDRYSDCTMDSNAKLQRSLNSPNFSDSIGGSTPPKLSLISSNLVSRWYTPEVTSTESMNFDEVIQSEAEVQQLLAQHNGQKSITRKQAHYVVGASQIEEKTSSIRTEVTPEANPFRHVSGNNPHDTLPSADSLVSSSYLSMSRNTLQFLNKPDVADAVSPPTDVNQQPNTSASQSECGSIGHNVSLSENHQKQPISPQHYGLTLGPPLHVVPLTDNGRSSALSRFWYADDEKVWPPNEGQGHGLPVSLRTRALESGELRLAQKDLSAAETSTQPTTGTPGPPLQPSVLTNEVQSPGLLPSHFAVQFSSASVAHCSPYIGSTNHRSSHNFTSGRGFADESIVVEKAGVSRSSTLESKLESTSIPISVGRNSILGQQRHSLREERSSPGVFQSFHAPIPGREIRLQLTSLHETNNQSSAKVESPMNSESGAHLGPREHPITLQPTLTNHASRLDKNSTDNMAADYSRGNVFSGSMAQLKAVEEVHLSESQGQTRVSAMQTNPSSVYSHAHNIQSEVQAKMLWQAHLRSLLGQTPALQVVQQDMSSQSKNLIERPLHVGQKVSDSHNTSPLELAAIQQSSKRESPDEEGKNLGIVEGQDDLKCSNQHAHPHFGPDAQDSRPQVASTARAVRQLQHSFPTSMLTPFKSPQSGPTVFSDRRLVTGAPFIHEKVESQAHSQLPSCSSPKDLCESAQGHSQRRVYATGAPPSGRSEKTQNSSSIKKQARMLSSSSLALSGRLAEQSGIMLQPSESVDRQFSSSTKEGPNVTADDQINSSIKEGQNFAASKRSADLQGSSSKSAKTISSLPLKRKKECPPLMPWHMAIAQSAASLPTTSDAELQWAAAVNRLPDKGDEGVDLHDKNQQFAYRAKQRLRLTTQLMQTIVAPAPAALMQSCSGEGRESATYTVAKVVLGDACSLAGGRSRQDDRTSRKDICGGCNFTDLASKGTILRPEAATELMDEFKERVKRLDNCLLRLESLPSASEIMTAVQQLDKLYISNRLVDRHFDEFAIEEMDSSSGEKAISVVSHGAQKVFPRRYVTAVPMPSNLPEGTHLISL